MALTVSSLELYQFRNYRHFSLENPGKVTVFIGENAVGKTNLLEALHLVCACHSFRHATSDQLIINEAEDGQSRVCAILDDDSRHLTVEMRIRERKRQYLLNGKARRSAEIRGLAPSVVFTPDDLLLVKGAQNDRRMSLDALGEQLRPGYQSVRLDYLDVFRHKNKLLKEGYGEDYLAAINDMIVTCGAQLSFYRASLFDRFAPKIIERYHQLSSGKENLTCEYRPSWVEHGHLDLPSGTEDDGHYHPVNLTRDDARDFIRQSLDNRLADEMIRQRAFIGPHMDKILFSIDGKDASVYASQGQQRSIVLAWKLAEVDLIQEYLHTAPILLLDDVMSELDASRREALEACISSCAQAFITTTNLGYFSESLLKNAAVIHLPLEENSAVS